MWGQFEQCDGDRPFDGKLTYYFLGDFSNATVQRLVLAWALGFLELLELSHIYETVPQFRQVALRDKALLEVADR